jgi:putative ribosome biogenesis GTPase RsgA
MTVSIRMNQAVPIKHAVEKGEIPQVRYENYLQIMKMIQDRKERYL